MTAKECRDLDRLPATPLTVRRIAQIAKALSHPERVRILSQFESQRRHIVQEIVGESTLAQSTVSAHLRILREAGLLTTCKDGPRTWYCFRPSVLEAFVAAVARLAADDEPTGR